jgi:hypothetical protein
MDQKIDNKSLIDYRDLFKDDCESTNEMFRFAIDLYGIEEAPPTITNSSFSSSSSTTTTSSEKVDFIIADDSLFNEENIIFCKDDFEPRIYDL